MLVTACAVLTACAAPRSLSALEQSLPATDEAQAAGLHTDLIRGMIHQGQLYAALAHIEDQKTRRGAAEELRLLEAEVLRRLGHDAQAEVLYRGLLNGRLGGEAHHGLGLVYATRDLDTAVDHLARAVRRRPTNVEFRNDLGYALLRAGRHREAMTHLATAVELDPQGEKARNNLIILMLVTGDEARAQRLAQAGDVGEQTFANLRRQAQALTNARGARTAGNTR
jgi:Flp pilus assembly protein TadD